MHPIIGDPHHKANPYLIAWSLMQSKRSQHCTTLINGLRVWSRLVENVQPLFGQAGRVSWDIAPGSSRKYTPTSQRARGKSGGRTLAPLHHPFSALFPAFLTHPINLKRMPRSAVVVASADIFFKLLDFVGEELDGAAAAGADHVVMAAAVVLVLVAGDAVVEGDFAGEVALGEELEGAVDGGVADLGVFLLDQAVELVGGKVLAGLEEGLEDGVALGGVLEADTLEVLVEDALRFANHLGGDGGLIIDALVQGGQGALSRGIGRRMRAAKTPLEESGYHRAILKMKFKIRRVEVWGERVLEKHSVGPRLRIDSQRPADRKRARGAVTFGRRGSAFGCFPADKWLKKGTCELRTAAGAAAFDRFATGDLIL